MIACVCMASLLALLTAILYGSGDFFGGVSSRRNSTIQVLFTISLLGAVPLCLVAPFVASGIDIRDWVFGSCAGISGLVGLGLLYRGLSRGPMAAFAPISAVAATALPVFWGVLRGDEQLLRTWFGIFVGMTGVFILSMQRGAVSARVRSSVVVEALLSGVGFGLFFALLSETSETAAPWPIVAGRTSAIGLILIVSALRGSSLRPQGNWVALFLCAICDTGANVAFLFALKYGQLGSVAVIASLYPAVTVLLARLILNERLTPQRFLGVFLALVSVLLISGA